MKNVRVSFRDFFEFINMNLVMGRGRKAWRVESCYSDLC